MVDVILPMDSRTESLLQSARETSSFVCFGVLCRLALKTHLLKLCEDCGFVSNNTPAASAMMELLHDAGLIDKPMLDRLYHVLNVARRCTACKAVGWWEAEEAFNIVREFTATHPVYRGN